MSSPNENQPAGLIPAGPRLIAALSAVQGELHSIGKDREVSVRSEKGAYKFKYATLAEIWDAIRGPCAKNGLAISQPATVDHTRKVVSVRTLVMHVSGEALESVTDLPVASFGPQGIGSIISYARRYGLSSLLGVTSADDDDDANEGTAEVAPKKPVRVPRPAEVMRFGKHKGEKLAGLESKQLLTDVTTAEEKVRDAKGDEPWLAGVKTGITEVRGELARRVAGRKSASAPTGPGELTYEPAEGA